VTRFTSPNAAVAIYELTFTNGLKLCRLSTKLKNKPP